MADRPTPLTVTPSQPSPAAPDPVEIFSLEYLNWLEQALLEAPECRANSLHARSVIAIANLRRRAESAEAALREAKEQNKQVMGAAEAEGIRFEAALRRKDALLREALEFADKQQDTWDAVRLRKRIQEETNAQT